MSSRRDRGTARAWRPWLAPTISARSSSTSSRTAYAEREYGINLVWSGDGLEQGGKRTRQPATSHWKQRGYSAKLTGVLKRFTTLTMVIFNAKVVPDRVFEPLAINRAGRLNESGGADEGTIECEVEVIDDCMDLSLQRAEDLIGQPVSAVGVFAEDTEHSNKTELHPLDLIFGELDKSRWPAWVSTSTTAAKSDIKVYRIWQRRMIRVFISRHFRMSNERSSLNCPAADAIRK